MDSAAPAKTRHLLINRNFSLLWVGQAISLLGDQVFDTTMTLWIGTVLAKGLDSAPLLVSGALVAAALPVILVGPIAGVFVDRWDKSQTMLRTDLLRAVLIALLLATSGLVPLPFLPNGRLPFAAQMVAIYLTVFGVSFGSRFFYPSRIALIGDLVPEPERARASGLEQVTQSLASILGPPVAAPVLFAFGVSWALGLNALSFVLSFVVILAIRRSSSAGRPPEGDPGHFWAQLREGLSFVAGSKTLVTMFIAGMLTMMGAGAINTLNVFFVTRNLHAAPELFGLVEAAFGFGVLGGAILSGPLAARIGAGRLFSLSLVALGLFCVVWARMASFEPALPIMAGLGAAIAASNVAFIPLLLGVVPRELVGRVISLFEPLTILATMLSAALSGYLASAGLRDFHSSILGISLGPIDTIFTVAGVLILLGGLYASGNLPHGEGDLLQVETRGIGG